MDKYYEKECPECGALCIKQAENEMPTQWFTCGGCNREFATVSHSVVGQPTTSAREHYDAMVAEQLAEAFASNKRAADMTFNAIKEGYANRQKPSNPKDLIGSDKLPLHLWPTTATAMGSLGLLDGMLKYGRSNFRAIGVRSSIYYDAARRHLDAWFEGEDSDPDSGLPHLSHVLACIAIIVDAEAADKLNDDRATAGGYRKLLGQLTPHVKRLKEMHAGKTPKHFSIADEVCHEKTV